MQMTASVGRKTNDIARVGRNFGLNQDDVEHTLIVFSKLAYLPIVLPFAQKQPP